MSGHENPPAFPSVCLGDPGHPASATGMTLRDWFASHADQPGVSEIVSKAGHKTDGFWVMFSDGSDKMKFTEWWNSLPLADRCMLFASARYDLADAMLKARVES